MRSTKHNACDKTQSVLQNTWKAEHAAREDNTQQNIILAHWRVQVAKYWFTKRLDTSTLEYNCSREYQKDTSGLGAETWLEHVTNLLQMKLERNCQLRSVRDVECGSALWKNHNWRKYNCCHSVMWPRSFAGQWWWRYKSTKVAQEALVAPFTDTVSSLFCWTIPPALIYSHGVGRCLDSCLSRLSSREQINI